MKERKCANKEIVEVWDKTFECPVFSVIWQQMLFSVNFVYVDVLVLQQILYTLAAVNSLRFKLEAKWQIETKYYSLFWRDDLCSIPGGSGRFDCSHQKERPLASCRWLQEYSIVHSRPIMVFLFFCSFRPNLGLYDEANAPLFNSPHMITPHLDRLRW